MIFDAASPTPTSTASTGVSRIPPCEAMLPYIRYQGVLHRAVIGTTLSPSDQGSVVTTVGPNPSQAQSCMRAGTEIYAVYGYPITSRLAANFTNGLMLFEAVSLTPTPSA